MLYCDMNFKTKIDIPGTYFGGWKLTKFDHFGKREKVQPKISRND